VENKKRIQIAIFVVLILAALGLAIPRLVKKPEKERFTVKESSAQAAKEKPREPGDIEGSESLTAQAMLQPGEAPQQKSDNAIGRNPFRELILPATSQPESHGSEAAIPLSGQGSMGSGPLWPNPRAGLEPFPGGLSGFGSLPDGAAAPVSGPDYSVTGIVSGENTVAVLRTSDQRMYVRPGDVLDDGSRVASVFRDRVVLNRPDGQHVLVLGGSKDEQARDEAGRG
jgi:hypothetical protein